MYERKILLRYFAEFFATMAVYAVVLIGSIDLAKHLPRGLEQTAIVLVPMIPFLLMLAVLARHIRRLDEYVRLQMRENIVLVAGVTAGWTFTYGFLEGVGFPHLSMFTIWPAMCGTFVAVVIVRALLRR